MSVEVRTPAHAALVYRFYRRAERRMTNCPPHGPIRERMMEFNWWLYRWLAVPDSLAAAVA